MSCANHNSLAMSEDDRKAFREMMERDGWRSGSVQQTPERRKPNKPAKHKRKPGWRR
jgi:hypothetical protein